MAYRQGDAVRLLSRAGIDCAGRFRELAAAIASLPASTLILDGEVAVFDDQLRSRLDFLRRPDPQALVTPPIYVTFDCVYVDERDLRHCPLGARREVLGVRGAPALHFLHVSTFDGTSCWRCDVGRPMRRSRSEGARSSFVCPGMKRPLGPRCSALAEQARRSAR